MKSLFHQALKFTAVLAATLTLSSCGGASYSYQNVTVALSPQITTLAVGASQTFTATTVNAPNYPDFYLTPGGSGGPQGTLVFNAGKPSAVYTAPATPPIYTSVQLAAGAVQGQVTITAFVSNSTSNIFSDAVTSQTITITAPSVTVGIAPAAATVARNTVLQFTGYAVGNVNGALTWQVNGVTGGSTASGTISATGLYTAPTAIPMSGPSVMVAAVSVADPTKSAAAIVTVN